MVLTPLEEANVVRTLIIADMRIMGCRATQRACTRPDELPIVIVDVWSGIRVPVWCKEDVAWGNQFRSEDVEVDNGSVKIRSLVMTSDGDYNVSYSCELTDRNIDVGEVLLSRPASAGPRRRKRAAQKLDRC